MAYKYEVIGHAQWDPGSPEGETHIRVWHDGGWSGKITIPKIDPTDGEVEAFVASSMVAREASVTAKAVSSEALLVAKPAATVDELRQVEYVNVGCTIDALTVAIVEHIKEDRPEALTALQVLRAAVKIKYPKT